MKLLHRMADSRSEHSWATSLRRRRFALFRSLFDQIPRPARILDVGGTPGFWEMMGFSTEDCEIVVMNVGLMPVRQPNVVAVVGDARAMPEYVDGSFDVVFSNSVIEHVGSFEDQRRFAAEIRRVGRRYFVQTPNRYFPIEPHFLLPGWQFLPLSLRVALIRRYNIGWYKRVPDPAAARALVAHIRLLSEGELRQLFGEATLYKERVFGLTKSFVVYNGWPT